MNRDHRALSAVREESPFTTPPHILVMADDDSIGEAVELAEALDHYGADAEVRIAADRAADYYAEPDAVIFAGGSGDLGALRYASVRVAVADSREQVPGYDLVVGRPINASALMERLGECLPHLRG